MRAIDPAARAARPEFDVHVEENIMVAMRDGVRLATDLYRPARAGRPLPGPRPALLHRTPYNKTETEATLGPGRWFASRGYVVIDQDCRGCFGSEGLVDFLLPEAEDGFDTLEWIKRQEWSDGTVGSFGCSWSSWTQTAMAGLGPDALHAMVPNMSGADAHESSVRHGGALELRFLAWAFWHSAYNTQRALTARPFVTPALNLGAPVFSDWLRRMPIRRGQTQLALVPPYEKWALEILTRADYDEYWRHPSLNPRLHWDRFPDVPVLLVGGWYDSYTRGTWQNWAGLAPAKRGPIRVLMGPWTHGATTPELSYAGDVEFGPAAALASFDDLHLRWFDRWLRGVDNGLDAEAPIRLFVMGGGSGQRSGGGRLVHGGRWRDEQEWPLARTVFTDYFLHEDGGLRRDLPAPAVSSTTYRFDPANPVPSIGGNVSSLRDVMPLPPGIGDPTYSGRGNRTHDVMRAGGFDQQEGPDFFGCRPPYLPLGARPDVLVFETDPLTEPLEVTGPIEVMLWVATSAPDTDFTAKLIDVYPPSPWYPRGYALNLSDSIARLRYRGGREQGSLVRPGEAVEIGITLYPTSNVFMPGHRLRLDISSSNFPRFDVNPNTGEPIGRDRRRAVADNTVFHERARPSRMILPVIPDATGRPPI
ncbi:MAG TPA: CocE/NonD family hydrolase [Candidatus Binatia bacterium]|nr:CocE/NonD family hydrolase [Candidatus Binatia bacterium]